MKRLLTAFLLGVLFSCMPNNDQKEIASNEADRFARQFIIDIQQHKIDKCLTKVADNMRTEKGREFISNVASNISTLQLDSLKLINASYTKFFGDDPTTNYTLEYEQVIGDQSIYFFFNIHKKKDNLKITGFDARWMEAPLKEIHAFNLGGKPVINYVFLILAIASAGFILFTLVVVIRTPMKRKWLWVIVVLFGFVKFKLNWTTSEFDFNLLSFQLFGSGYFKASEVAPLILTFSLPVFAIAFWVKKFQQEKQQAEEQKMANIIAKHSDKKDDKNA